MTIIDAAKALNEGKKIRRKSWGEKQTPAIKSEYNFLQFGEEQTSLRAILIEELLADDWELYEEKSLMELALTYCLSGIEFRTSDEFDAAKAYFKRGWNAAQLHFNQSK